MSVKLDFLCHLVEIIFISMSEGSEFLLLLKQLNLDDAADSA